MSFADFLDHTNLLTGMVNLMTIMLGVFGLSSHYYSNKRDRYYASNLMLVYATVVTLTFSVVYLKEIYNDFMLEQFDVSNVTKLYSYMNIIASVVGYITGLVFKREMPIFMNKAQIVERVNFLGISKDMVIRPIGMVLLRAVLIPVAIEVVLISNHLRNEPERSVLWTTYVLFPMIISQIIPNCVFGVFELCRVYIVALNAHLRDIQTEVNGLQTEEQMLARKPYYRMKRFCELADRLDALAEKYTPICYQALEYMDMYALPFVFALLCNVLGIIVGFYVQYHAIVNTVIEGKHFDVYNSVTNVIFLVISISEIIFLANASSDNITAIRETGFILQSIKLVHADVRFKQSVEAFSFISYTNQYKIKPLGLLEINIQLMSDVSSAVTSFLLILIQSDLALRFTLK